MLYALSMMKWGVDMNNKKSRFPFYFRYAARPDCGAVYWYLTTTDDRPKNGHYHFRRIKSGKYTAVYNKRIGAVEMRARGTVYAREFTYWEEARRTMRYLNKMP